jgi:hypothetical protein
VWHQETVAQVGIVPTDLIKVFFQAGEDSDENTAEMLDNTFISAVAGTDAIVVTVVSDTPFSGPIKIAYEAI